MCNSVGTDPHANAQTTSWDLTAQNSSINRTNNYRNIYVEGYEKRVDSVYQYSLNFHIPKHRWRQAELNSSIDRTDTPIRKWM